MYRERLAASPCVLHDIGLANVGHLLKHIQLAQAVMAQILRQGLDRGKVLLAHIAHMANPTGMWWGWFLAPLMFPIELVSFLVRPFSLGLRLFVAMTAGHVLLKVLAGFVINSTNAGLGYGALVGIPSFTLMIGISALEMLVACIQAYVFALLTSLYINDAEHLH